MTIRIHEIELGTRDTAQSQKFYQDILGLSTVVDQLALKVFDSGTSGLDFNVSNHLPANVVMISFITDDLNPIIHRLKAAGIPFSGPKPTHLNMTTVEFRDPSGFLVRVNLPAEASLVL